MGFYDFNARTIFNLQPYTFFFLAFIGTAKWRNAVLYGRCWILTQGRQGQAANCNNGF
jgi:hypothetical protein